VAQHRRRRLRMRSVVFTGGTKGFVDQVYKWLELLRAVMLWLDGLGWHYLCRRTSTGLSIVEHDKQPLSAARRYTTRQRHGRYFDLAKDEHYTEGQRRARGRTSPWQ
jgi:hypothetical protein